MKTSDPLSSFLRLLRIAKLVVGEASISPTNRIAVPDGQLSFYAIRSGSCCLKLDKTAEEHHLHEGDFLLLTDGVEHSLNEVKTREKHLSSQEITTPPLPNEINLDDENDCVAIFGHASLEPLAGNPFKQYLPEFLRVHRDESHLLQSSHFLLDMISQECQSTAPGSEATTEQLVQVLIMHTVRSHVVEGKSLRKEGETANPTRLLQASADPQMGSILNAIHDYPGDPWTVIGLAKRSRMSKSAFSEKFRDLVGQSPMQYVTEVRFQKACEMLAATDLGIQQIANLSGYGSASSFSTAFRQKLGQSPIDYRGVQMHRSKKFI